MNDTDRFRLLQEAAAKLGIEVRQEEGGAEEALSAGGLCRVAGKPVLLINARATLQEKSRIMIGALRQFDLESIYLRPAIRELLDPASDEDP